MIQNLDVSTPRLAPDTLLRQLREIDEDAHVIYLGEGEWALGVVAPAHMERRERAVNLIRRANTLPLEKQNPAVMRLARAAQQGFRVVGRYSEADMVSGFMVEDFRVADFVYRQGRDAAFERLLDNCEADVDEEAVKEAALYKARDAWHFIMKGRKHFIPK
jgi:hypothetical protein